MLKKNKNKPETGRLRDDDFLLVYWLAPGGNTAWMYRRNDELFLGYIMSNHSEKEMHLPYSSDKAVAICHTMGVIGFTEFPVYDQWSMLPIETRKRLTDNFEIYDEALVEARKKHEEQLKQQAEAAANANNADGTPPEVDVTDGSEQTDQSKPKDELTEKREKQPAQA